MYATWTAAESASPSSDCNICCLILVFESSKMQRAICSGSAVLTPGRKAYWDDSSLLLETHAWRVRLLMIFVSILSATSMSAIGLVSSRDEGDSVLGMGTIKIFFQFLGTLPFRMHRFSILSRAVITASSQFWRTPILMADGPGEVVSFLKSTMYMSWDSVMLSAISK